MNKGKTIFAQVVSLINTYEFKRFGIKVMPKSTLAETNEKRFDSLYQHFHFNNAFL